MNKLKLHFRRWDGWRKHNRNSRFYKILVLLGLIKSPTFNLYLLPEELPNVRNMYFTGEMFNHEAFEAAKAFGASIDI